MNERPGVFIGDVVRRGRALKLDVSPVFSLFHPHGPVFRVMFRVDKGGGARSRYDAHDVDDGARQRGIRRLLRPCGNTEIIKRPLIDVFGHNKTVEDANGERSSLMCSTCARRGESGERSARLAVSGPLWIGSLHDRATVEAMRDEADALGWLRDDDEDASPRVKGQLSLRDLLDAFRAEADPALRSPHYFRTERARTERTRETRAAEGRAHHHPSQRRVRGRSKSSRSAWIEDERVGESSRRVRQSRVRRAGRTRRSRVEPRRAVRIELGNQE